MITPYEHRVHRSIPFRSSDCFGVQPGTRQSLTITDPRRFVSIHLKGFPYRSHAMRNTPPWDLIVIMGAQLIHQSSSIEIDLFIHSFKIYLFIYYRVQRVMHARNSDHATN